MQQALIEGFIIGLGMMVFLGPVFFTLLKGTLEFGFLAGFFVAIGVFISDIICVTICMLGAAPFLENSTAQYYLGIFSGIILIYLGIKYALVSSVSTEVTLTKTKHLYSTMFVKGFMVNFLNPFVFIVWIGVIGFGKTKFENDNMLYFLGAALFAILLTDNLKAFFAHKIKPLIQPSILLYVFKVIGLFLVGLGIRMIYLVY